MMSWNISPSRFTVELERVAVIWPEREDERRKTSWESQPRSRHSIVGLDLE